MSETRKQEGYVGSEVITMPDDEGAENSAAGQRWIAMSNALTRASHGLTLAEKRIVMIAVSKLDSRAALPTPGKAVPTTKITAAEYAELAGCESSAAYEAMQEAAKHLYNRSIMMFEPSFKRGRKRIGDAGTVTQMRWCGRATYEKQAAWIEIAWWPEIVPHLLNLKKNFTKYQLHQASALRSIYSWRMLELLSRFRQTGYADYTIEDFATSMGATEKQRQDFNNLRRRMIEPAVKELKEKDGWDIDWEPVRSGRKVTSLRFKFSRQAQDRMVFDDADEQNEH